MISSLSIISIEGKILATRDYRGEVSRRDINSFVDEIIKKKNASDTPPVVNSTVAMSNSLPTITTSKSTTFAFIKEQNLYFLATSVWDCNSFFVIEVLKSVVEVLKAYFGGVSINITDVTDKLPLVYALFDEIMDAGYPQITTPTILKEYILEKPLPFDKIANRAALAAQKQSMRQASRDATGACSWRKQGIVYKRNELYLDAVEKVNALLSNSGEVLYAEVNGLVKMKAKLSGMPECRIGINDKLQMENSGNSGKGGSVKLNSLTFHQCVSLSQYEEKREVNFIPPDGEFELIKYRMNEAVNLPFKVIPICNIGRTSGEISVKIKSEFPAGMTAYNVTLTIPLPKNIAKADAKATTGKAKVELNNNKISWVIKELEGGGKDADLEATLKMVMTMQEKAWEKPPCKLDFSIPMFTASGFRVRFLKVFEKSNYVPTKWVRYVSTAGEYEIRM